MAAPPRGRHRAAVAPAGHPPRRGRPGPRSLAELAASLGLPAHRPHDAEGDALTTAQAFLALATHLEAHGRGTVAALTGAGWLVRAWRLVHERDARL